MLNAIRFYFRAVSDARNDPFLPAPLLVAPFWVLRHWRFLRKEYSNRESQ